MSTFQPSYSAEECELQAETGTVAAACPAYPSHDIFVLSIPATDVVVEK